MATPAAAPWCAPGLSAPTFCFAPAKTWYMPVTYLQRNADGTAGAPVNLSGGIVTGILFTRGNLVGVPLTVSNGGVTVDPVNGVMNFLVSESVTAGFVADNIPPFADSYNYPTRLEVDFRDTMGHLDVAAVFPIFVFDPRFVDPSTFPTQQAGTIVSGGSQGPAGPISGILNKPALAPLGGHTVVKSGLGGVDKASSDSVGDAGSVIGISLNAAIAAGQAVQVATDGEIFEATWAWAAGPVFLGLAGALTQTPPATGILQQIGVASSPTSILIDIQDPTLRQ